MGGPLPPVPTPPNIIPLDPVEQLGKDLLYDTTMSNPSGYACVQCHAYTAGFTSGLESIVNLAAGVPPGVVPGRWDNRKAYTYGYAAFSPEGPYYDTTRGSISAAISGMAVPMTPPSRRKGPPSTPTR